MASDQEQYLISGVLAEALPRLIVPRSWVRSPPGPRSDPRERASNSLVCHGLTAALRRPYGDQVRETLLFVSHVAPTSDGPAGVHGVLDQAELGFRQIAELTGMQSRRIDDVRSLEEVALSRSRVLALFTIGETPWTHYQRAALFAGLRAGRLAILAIHSAMDACRGWDRYGALVGARADGDAVAQPATIEVVDRDHPSTSHLGRRWEWYDELYRHKEMRADARVLLAGTGEPTPADGVAQALPAGAPLAWCFTEGSGRVFATGLGHVPAAWESRAYLGHLLGGLRWALGDDI